MTKVELFETIRRDRFINGKSVRAIAAEQGVHRRVVRQALKDAVPPSRKRSERVSLVLTAELRAVIDQWLLADREAPRKQRHTARRVTARLRTEHDYRGAESTVRRVVAARRRELGLGRGTFVPLAHDAGAEAEVDWYEADVDFPAGRERVQFFAMRSCFSGRDFHMAFPRQTQQAFLEALCEAFAYFGGAFGKLRFDNLTAAVKRVLRWRRRVETDRFVAVRSHFLFGGEFCVPGPSTLPRNDPGLLVRSDPPPVQLMPAGEGSRGGRPSCSPASTATSLSRRDAAMIGHDQEASLLGVSSVVPA